METQDENRIDGGWRFECDTASTNLKKDVLVDRLPARLALSEVQGRGMPIQSLFLGLLLCAMGSVMVREVFWQGHIEVVDSRWVIGTVLAGMAVGGSVSLASSLIYRLEWLQVVSRSLIGVMVGGVGASTVLLSSSSVPSILMTIAVGAVMLVGAGALTFRWRLHAESSSERG